MQEKKLLSTRVATDGTLVNTFMHMNADGERAHRIQTEYDPTALHESLKKSQSFIKKTDGMRMQRVIPQHVLARAMAEGWLHCADSWRRWANSPEGAAWGVEYDGKVQKL